MDVVQAYLPPDISFDSNIQHIYLIVDMHELHDIYYGNMNITSS